MSENNVVVLRGKLAGEISTRELGRGVRVVQFDVRTVDATGTHHVPVAWFDPPTVPVVAPGDDLVVVGSVRRRFFRSGGATQSRTEVVADAVVDGARRRQVRAAIERAVAAVSPARG